MTSLSIDAVRIQDYRVIDHLVLDLDLDETVIIGENNTGKSAVLRALDVALGGTQPADDDLHVNAAGQAAASAEIDVLIVPLDGIDFDVDVNDLFGAAVLQPTAAIVTPHIVLRTTTTQLVGKDGVQLRRAFVTEWHVDRREGDGVIARVAGDDGRVRAPHIAAISYSLLDASRDLVAELRQKTSNWGRVLRDLGLDPDDQTDIQNRLKALGDDVTAKSPTLTSAQDALRRLTTVLSSGASDIDISALPPSVDEIGRAVDVLVTAPDSAPLPLRAQGSGSRSLVSLLVFRSLVELRIAESATVDPLPLVGIEEPEAHLHPQAQAAAYHQIADLPGQRIVVTHSPNIAGAADPRRLRRLERIGASVRVHTLADTEDSDATVLKRFVLRYNAQVLFARLAVLVEGETDEPLVGAYARAKWLPADADGAGLVVVSAEGVTNMTHIATSLTALGIPWLALVDNDQAGRDEKAKLDTLVGRDTSSAPRFVFNTGHADIEHLAVLDHRDHVIDGIVDVKAMSPQHETALRRQLAPETDSQLVARLEQVKGRWGGPFIDAVVGAAESIPVLDQLVARARTILGGAP